MIFPIYAHATAKVRDKGGGWHFFKKGGDTCQVGDFLFFRLFMEKDREIMFCYLKSYTVFTLLVETFAGRNFRDFSIFWMLAKVYTREIVLFRSFAKNQSKNSKIWHENKKI